MSHPEQIGANVLLSCATGSDRSTSAPRPPSPSEMSLQCPCQHWDLSSRGKDLLTAMCNTAQRFLSRREQKHSDDAALHPSPYLPGQGDGDPKSSPGTALHSPTFVHGTLVVTWRLQQAGADGALDPGMVREVPRHHSGMRGMMQAVQGSASQMPLLSSGKNQCIKGPTRSLERDVLRRAGSDRTR